MDRYLATVMNDVDFFEVKSGVERLRIPIIWALPRYQWICFEADEQTAVVVGKLPGIASYRRS